MPCFYSLLRKSDISADYGIPISTLNRWIKSGKWPKPIKLGSTPFWRKADVEKFLTSLAEMANSEGSQ